MIKKATLVLAAGLIGALAAGDAGAQTWTTTPAPMCDMASHLKAREPGCVRSTCLRHGRCYTNLGSWGPHPNSQKQKYLVTDNGCLRLACSARRMGGR